MSASLTPLFFLLTLACDTGVPNPVDALLVDELGLGTPDADLGSKRLSTPPARAGNRVKLLINGEAAFASRLELVAQAKHSIYIQVLIFKGDDTGKALAEALIRKKQSNPKIDIRVIVDALANIQDVDAQLMFFQMKNAGIEVEGFEAFYLHWLNELDAQDLTSANKRYHEKYWIVDGKRAVVGGMNLADEYARCSADPLLIWRDQDVLLEGPVVKDVYDAFLDNYAQLKAIKLAKPDLMNTDAYWKVWRERNAGVAEVMNLSVDLGQAVRGLVLPEEPRALCDGLPVPTAVHEDLAVRFVRSRPREGERHIHDLYMAELAKAKDNVLIENAYFVPSADLRAALSGAAKRGVTVQVVTNSMATNDITLITALGRSYYLELIDSGVQMYEWHAEKHGEGTLHSKTATFDDRTAIIGSYNLDPRSQDLNSENVVVIEDLGLATELAQWGRNKDLALAERITRAQALSWADPASLPPPPGDQPLWSDPTFDPKTYEYFLMRQVEAGL